MSRGKSSFSLRLRSPSFRSPNLADRLVASPRSWRHCRRDRLDVPPDPACRRTAASCPIAAAQHDRVRVDDVDHARERAGEAIAGDLDLLRCLMGALACSARSATTRPSSGDSRRSCWSPRRALPPRRSWPGASRCRRCSYSAASLRALGLRCCTLGITSFDSNSSECFQASGLST